MSITATHPLVLGAGSWGTALALVLAHHAPAVWLWGHNPQHVAAMQQQRCNQRFLPQATFPANLHVTDDLATCLPMAHTLVIAVPSHAFRSVLQQIAPLLNPSQRICWASKGLEEGTGLLLHEVVAEVLGIARAVAVLSGPSFAKEVAAQLPTAVTIASPSLAYAQQLAQQFHTPYFRPYTHTDIVGVQLGGAVKNVIAIAAGIADGLNLGANTRAALITRGLAEMMRLGAALGAQRETLMGLAGLGDLVLTCTDNQSRNRRFGYGLAQGHTSAAMQAEIGQVIEGIRAAQEVYERSIRCGVDMPIVRQVHSVLQQACSLQEAVQALLARETKLETL